MNTAHPLPVDDLDTSTPSYNDINDFIKNELSYLIGQATDIKLLISTSKTDTKRKFYQRKLKTLVRSIDAIMTNYKSLVHQTSL